MSSDVIFEGKGVTKGFGGLLAVSEVDFTVRRGEILGLIGPNGAGKTTLVNCITGVFPVDKGTMSFNGTRINGLKPHRITRLGIARTFQVVQPFPNLHALDNVAMGALFGHTRAENNIHQAREIGREKLEFVGLSKMAHRLAAELTLVERKRLELAKSLATDPELLLLDEVNAGLNRVETEEAISLIRKIRDQGVTILIIEHVMKVIMGLSDRVFVLHHGEKIADGNPHQVTSDEQVIRAYLGDKFAARIADSGG
ncbi:MAG: ABC transporter ATP-binding protein [Nitrospinota bacterium]